MIHVDDSRAHDPAGSAKPTPAASKYEVIVDRDLCIGAATCVDLAGQTFELDSENRAVVKQLPWNTDEEILDAAKSCPTLAIILKDKVTGKQLFPG